MKSIKNILVATDFSNDSDHAIEEAALLAKKFHSKLYLLDVIERIDVGTADYVIPFDVFNDQKEKLINDVRKKMLRKVAQMESRHQIKAVAEVRYGDIYDEILKEEVEKNIDLVVIAPHERKTFVGKLFSHLSDKIVKNSPCDTLIVRHCD